MPNQYEFARLNLTYVVLSKRKLIQLVKAATSTAGTTQDADARGRAAARLHAGGFRLMVERIGVSKSDTWIDMSVLEDCMRDDLNARPSGASPCSTR